MKKFFPLLLIILVFSGFLTGQIVFDYISLDAEPISAESTQLSAYTDYYQKHLKSKTPEVNSDRLEIVTFWASWCAPCLEELVSLQNVQNELGKDKIKIIAINGDEVDQEKKIAAVKKDLKLDFEIVADKTGFYFDIYNVSALPFTILYEKNVAKKLLDTETILQEGEFISSLKKYLL